MDKMKDTLKKRMQFIAYNRTPEKYFILELEFIDFLFETPEFAEIIRKIVLKNKIPYRWLQDIFNSYIVYNNHSPKENNVNLPLFYNEEVEEQLGLKKSFLGLLEEELINSNRALLKEERSTEDFVPQYPYQNESWYNLKKLHLDIVQEIDLLKLRKNTTNPSKEPFFVENFDRKRGILKFANQEIELSKKGKETDAVLLLNTLLNEKTNDWKHNDEILNDWGYNDEDMKDLPKNKVYFAGKNINNAIAMKVQIDDFIECNTTKARINPKYRKKEE